MSRLQEADLLKTLVCEHFDISRKDLLHGKKLKTICKARHTLAWILRTRGLSYPDIGAEMAGRDHSTAINSAQQVNANLALLDDVFAVLARFELELVCALPL